MFILRSSRTAVCGGHWFQRRGFSLRRGSFQGAFDPASASSVVTMSLVMINGDPAPDQDQGVITSIIAVLPEPTGPADADPNCHFHQYTQENKSAACQFPNRRTKIWYELPQGRRSPAHRKTSVQCRRRLQYRRRFQCRCFSSKIKCAVFQSA